MLLCSDLVSFSGSLTCLYHYCESYCRHFLHFAPVMYAFVSFLVVLLDLVLFVLALRVFVISLSFIIIFMSHFWQFNLFFFSFCPSLSLFCVFLFQCFYFCSFVALYHHQNILCTDCSLVIPWSQMDFQLVFWSLWQFHMLVVN